MAEVRAKSRTELQTIQKGRQKVGGKEIKVLTKETMTKQMICTFNTFIEVTAAR